MKNFFVYVATFLAMLSVIYADDKPITPIPTECPKEDSLNFTVHIAHETDCSKFYKCQMGMKIPKDGISCPKINEDGDLLYFNPTLQVCDWPRNVDCQKTPFNDNSNLGEETVNEDVVHRLLMNRV